MNTPVSPANISDWFLFAERTLAEISGVETRQVKRAWHSRKVGVAAVSVTPTIAASSTMSVTSVMSEVSAIAPPATFATSTTTVSHSSPTNTASVSTNSQATEANAAASIPVFLSPMTREHTPTMVQAGPGLATTPTGSGPSYWDPQPFARILTNFVRQSSWNGRLKTSQVIAAWPKIVGEGIAKHTRVTSPAEKVLEIETNSTTWAEQLRILLPQIEKNIVEVAGSAVIEEIRIRGPKPRSWKRGKYSVAGRGPRDTYG